MKNTSRARATRKDAIISVVAFNSNNNRNNNNNNDDGNYNNNIFETPGEIGRGGAQTQVGGGLNGLRRRYVIILRTTLLLHTHRQ